MAETGPQAPVCRFPQCEDPVYAEGICRDHYEQFNEAAPAAVAVPRDAQASPAASGRLRMAPMHAVVRLDYGSDSRVVAVYGVYGTAELAGNAAAMLSSLDIPGDMTVVPFYEVTP